MILRPRLHQSLKIRIGADAHDLCFGDGIGLRKKRPVSCRRRPRPDVAPHLDRWKNIEQRQLFDAAGMVERKPIAQSSAAIMADDAETHVAQLLHHVYDVFAHSAFAIGLAVRAARRRRPAVAAQIHRHHMKALGELARHARPHEMGLRKPVQQKQRLRARIAAAARKYAALVSVDPMTGEAGEQVCAHAAALFPLGRGRPRPQLCALSLKACGRSRARRLCKLLAPASVTRKGVDTILNGRMG